MVMFRLSSLLNFTVCDYLSATPPSHPPTTTYMYTRYSLDDSGFAVSDMPNRALDRLGE